MQVLVFFFHAKDVKIYIQCLPTSQCPFNTFLLKIIQQLKILSVQEEPMDFAQKIYVISLCHQSTSISICNKLQLPQVVLQRIVDESLFHVQNDMLSIFFFTHQIFSYHIFVLQLGEIRLCCMNFVQPIHHDSVQFQRTEKDTKINSEKKCDLNIYQQLIIEESKNYLLQIV